MSPTTTLNPPAVVREVRSLAEIEAHIDREVGVVFEAAPSRSKLSIGRLLLEAKAQVPHGQWEAWVKARGLAVRTARDYMALAKSATVADLPSNGNTTYRDAGIDKRPRIADRDNKTKPTIINLKEAAQADARTTTLKRLVEFVEWTERTPANRNDEDLKWWGEDGPGMFDHGLTRFRVLAAAGQLARIAKQTFRAKQ